MLNKLGVVELRVMKINKTTQRADSLLALIFAGWLHPAGDSHHQADTAMGHA